MTNQEKELGSMIAFRNASSESDLAFIYSKWLQSFRRAPYAKWIPNHTYFSEHHKIIENLLRKSRVRLAVNAEDLDQIYGFLVSQVIDDVPVVHFVFVKDAFREFGIATALLNEININSRDDFVFTSHMTFLGNECLQKHRSKPKNREMKNFMILKTIKELERKEYLNKELVEKMEQEYAITPSRQIEIKQKQIDHNWIYLPSLMIQ